MTTLLIIAEDAAVRSSWTAAAHAAGLSVRAVAALLPAVDLLGTIQVDAVLVDARADGELELLAAVSAYRPMPPTVLVHDRESTPPARMHAAVVRPSSTPPDRLVHLIKRIMFHRQDHLRPTNLPVRVTPAAAKWTTRLSSAGASDDDSSELRLTFDGETSPDGFDLAAS